MSAFRVMTILIVALAALLFAGCGKDADDESGLQRSEKSTEESDHSEKREFLLKTTKTSICRIPEGVGADSSSDRWFVVGPELRQIAFVVKDAQSGNESVLLNNEMGLEFSGVSVIEFSPGGDRLAYIAYDSDSHYVVIDGLCSRPYWGIQVYYGFSPDGSNYFFMAYDSDDGPLYYVIEGKKTREFEMVWPLVFSPDSRRCAFFAGPDIDSPFIAVVVDNEIVRLPPALSGWEITLPGRLCFSPDSKHFAYSCEVSKVDDEIEAKSPRWLWIVDNEPGPFHEGIGDNSLDIPEKEFLFSFSPDGKKCAYQAFLDDDTTTVVVGNIGGKFEETGTYKNVDYPRWLGDGAGLVYIAEPEDKEYFVVFNGSKVPGYEYYLSPDTNRVAAVEVGDVEIVTIDGKTGQPYHLIDSLRFSPDSGHYAYFGVNKIKKGVYTAQLVFDGRETELYRRAWEPVFSPDSKEYSFVAQRDDVQYIVRNGVKESEYEYTEARPTWDTKYRFLLQGIPGVIRSLLYNPDGSHLAAVKTGVKESFVIVDGVEGSSYDAIIPNASGVYLIWDSNSSFHYLAVVGDKIYLVEEEIVEE